MSAGLFRAHRVLWLPLGFAWQPALDRATRCCDEMRIALELRCDRHTDHWECPDIAVVYHEPFDEYGLPIRDGGMSYLLIRHCPWCGAALPAARRDDWFDVIEEAGLDPDGTDKLPAEFLRADWRVDKTH
jgi:hypothetical protein